MAAPRPRVWPRVWRPRTLARCLSQLEGATGRPERFLTIQDELAATFTSLTKAIYDLNKTLEPGTLHSSPLPKLVVANFDDEQIWQQLELQNQPALQHFEKVLSTALDEDLSLFPEVAVQPGSGEPCLETEADGSEDPGADSEEEDDVGPEPEEEEEEEEEEEVSDLSGGEPRGDGVSTKEASRVGQRVSHDLSDDTDSDLDFDIGKLEQQSRAAREVPGKAVERDGVEDKFFRLADMEKFLEKMEEAHGKEEDDEDDEDDIDLFEDLDSDEDEGLLGGRNQKPGKSSRNLKYKDFFDPVDSDDGTAGTRGAEQGSDAEEEISKEDGEERISELDEDDNLEDADDARPRRASAKRVTFALPDDEEEEEQEEEEEEEEGMEEMDDTNDTGIFKDKKDATEVQSSFEKRQEKMREKIASLEKELLEKKSWQLQGEVTAQKRPENSLLEENLHFDHAVRLAPVITEDTTLRLEDLIKQRIRDQAWDDVVRKEKPKEEAFEYKKRLTLDHEKSKLSLAEVYEQEYLKLSQEKAAEEENPVHAEIQKLMDSLFLQLDALSNFHFIPKPPVPEIKVVSNLPAITMEEVAPVGVSDAALLAPEEVKGKNKAGDVKAAAEKTLTDRKRERRKRKLQKRMRLQEKEKRRRALEKSHPEQAGKITKAAAAQKLQQLTKTGRAALLKDEGKGKALKSSQAFFSHLQDQVKMEIGDAKKTEKKKKKKEQALSVHELKL